MRWLSSSQRQRWLFTPAALAQRRAAAHARVKGESGECPLTFDEEQLLVQTFLVKIAPLVSLPHLLARTPRVTVTAVHFYRRFFLTHSVLEHSPKLVMAVCVYLACQVEEERVSLKELASKIASEDVTPDAIAHAQYAVLDGIGFDLYVHSPHLALDGFVLDLQVKRENRFLGLRERAVQLLNEAVLTDALLLYSPSELALTAFVQASKDAVLQSAEKDVANEVALYLQDVMHEHAGWERLRELVEGELAAFFTAPKALDMAAVKVAYKKLTDYHKARAASQ